MRPMSGGLRAAALGGAATPIPISLSPVAFWLPSATVSSGSVADLSSNGYHLTQGTAAQRPAYNTGPNRLTFDGSNDNLVVPFGVTDAIASGNACSLILGFIGTNIQSAIRLQPDNAQYVIVGLDQAGTRKCIVSTDASVTLALTAAENSALHQIAVTWARNTVNGFKLYIDNSVSVQANTADVALPLLQHTYSPALGAFISNPAVPAELMTGSITYAGVYSRVLTATEVTQIYNWAQTRP